MVYKVSKGGVRSGNTLRGLCTYASKRYAKQACIIGHSSIAPGDIQLLVDTNIDDTAISEALTCTDVILSLNKKQRWRLPATLSHMIRSGYFDKDNAMFSILERHKLKKRANCVSFVCNRSRYGHVIPKQKRYFSFNMDKLADEQSRRMLKRAKAEMIKKAKVNKPKPKGASMKHIDVFTLSGTVNTNAHGPLSSSKPEYRLEVFYPCPRSCSLTFNPKYTDVKLEVNDEGQLEMRSNIRQSMKTHKHRNRMISKNIERLDEQLIREDVVDMWEEDNYDDTTTDNFSENNKDNESEDEDKESSDRKETDNILASLITHAEKAQTAWLDAKPIKRLRKSSKPSEKTEHDLKSHIVYTNEVNPRSTLVKPSTTKDTLPVAKNEIVVASSKVILLDSETSPDKLKDRFGQNYAEADCEPRRFILNVTDDVIGGVMTSRSVKNNQAYTSFLVFIHDGYYDEGLSSFKVQFNSMLLPDGQRIVNSLQFHIMSLEDITKTVISVLSEMKKEGMLSYNDLQVQLNVPDIYLKEKLNIQVEAFYTSEQLNNTITADTIDNLEILTLLDQWEQVVFCEICYADITPSHFESAPGTRLNSCGHSFCDKCWRSHFYSKLTSGALNITCPGYDCNKKVGPVTLLSVVHVKDLNLHLQRKCEADIETSTNTKWCPNSSCGRVIKLTSSKQNVNAPVDVTCACGLSLCFACLGQAHWPASCDQALDYLTNVPNIKQYKETDDEVDLPKPAATKKVPDVLEVEGRMCPRCNRFMEKDGGCSHMVCKCGFSFCWTCMKAVDKHGTTNCVENSNVVYSLSRRLRIRHLELLEPQYAKLSSDDTQIQRHKHRKATMYQRALQQRQDYSKKMSGLNIKELQRRIQHVAFTESGFRDEICSVCHVDELDDDPMSVLPYVSKFLRASVQMKQSLHHVAEFTFVLLHSVPNDVDRQRMLKLANDLSAFCSFISSVFESGPNQDPKVAFRRLVEIKTWANRALDILLAAVRKIRS